MTSPPDDRDATFDSRWRDLGLSDTVELSPGATITPRTLAAGAFGNAATRVGSAPGPVPSLAALPRISLGAQRAEGPGAAPSVSSADLELSTLLGEGGMGRVHLARQRSLKRDVAVKTLKQEADEGTQQALFSEAVITGSLEHPSIIPVHALGTDDDGRPVLVMKRVEGVEWRELLHDPNHAGWDSWTDGEERLVRNIEILIQLCNAVEFAHSRGIIHRDIKPENVMIGRFGEVYLVDFGIALRVAEQEQVAGQLFGTPGYMAPEMVVAKAVDERTDVYLLGATLHEVLTGELRHDGQSLHDVLLTAFMSEPFDYPVAVPEELGRLANRATHREPAERPPSAHDLRQGLSDYLRHRGSIAMSDAARDRLERLEAMVDGTDRRTEPDWLGAVQELMAEARFGFAQALDEWADNRAAQAGLQSCLEAMIRFELSRENVSGARSLLEQLSEPRSDLAAAVDALRTKLADDRVEREKLQKLAHDLDITVGSTPRFKVTVLVGIVVVSVSAYVFSSADGVAGLTRRTALFFAVYVFVAGLATLFVFRKELSSNALNRRFAAMFVVMGTVIVLHRLASYLVGTPMHEIFAVDSVLMTTAAAVGGATLHRVLFLPAVLLAAGAATAYAWPTAAVEVFAASTTVALAVTLVALKR